MVSVPTFVFDVGKLAFAREIQSLELIILASILDPGGISKALA